MKKVVETKSIIKSKRQHKNLKKILTKAKYIHCSENPEPSVKKCGKANCGTCTHLQELTEFEFKNKMTFKVKSNIDCSCKQVIYVLTCNGCKENYIGQTGDFRKRMTIHKQQIRQPQYEMISLSRHIRNCAKDETPWFYVFPMYRFFHNSTESERVIKEKRFIEIFKPKLNMM